MKFTIKKILTLIITLMVVSFFTFIAFQIIPGDSAITQLGTQATEEKVEALREAMNLNENVFLRYVKWLSNLCRGNFGISSQYDVPVSSLLLERMSVTIWLAVLSIILIIMISFPIGIIAAKNEGGVIDRVLSVLTHTGMGIPPFFLGIIITLLFGFVLKWFIPGRYISPQENFGLFLGYMIFPALANAIPKSAMVLKFLRSSIIRQLQMDYVRTARSKGNLENAILYRHVLKNAFIPVLTFIAMIIAETLAGSIMIEQVFSLPGLGRLLVMAISNRDYAVVQTIVLYIAATIVVINFIVDVLYQWIDPRVRVK